MQYKYVSSTLFSKFVPNQIESNTDSFKSFHAEKENDPEVAQIKKKWRKICFSTI